jgi:RNA polymerase-binding transcription factor DksA
MSTAEAQRYGECPYCGDEIERLHKHIPLSEEAP